MKSVRKEGLRYEAIKTQKDLITLFRNNLNPQVANIFIELIVIIAN